MSRVLTVHSSHRSPHQRKSMVTAQNLEALLLQVLPLVLTITSPLIWMGSVNMGGCYAESIER
jgi:hypothetical protein